MSEALKHLVHDVGKYVSRIARNVPEGAAVPAALAPLLVKDLYETHRGRPARERFEALRGELDAALTGELEPLFVELTVLEPAVRRHEDAALRRGVWLALEIDRRLRRAAEAP
jgi:hypothetical protein